MTRTQTLVAYLVPPAAFCGLLAAAIIRSVGDPGGTPLWRIVAAIAAGLAVVAIVALMLWVPGALAFRAARGRPDTDVVFLAARDRSMRAVVDDWPTEVQGISPHLFSPIDVSERGIRIWAGGSNAQAIASIPTDRIASISVEFGPFTTVSPIFYLEIHFHSTEHPLSFVPYGRTGLLPLGRARLIALAGMISHRLSLTDERQ